MTTQSQEAPQSKRLEKWLDGLDRLITEKSAKQIAALEESFETQRRELVELCSARRQLMVELSRDQWKAALDIADALLLADPDLEQIGRIVATFQSRPAEFDLILPIELILENAGVAEKFHVSYCSFGKTDLSGVTTHSHGVLSIYFETGRGKRVDFSTAGRGSS